MKVTTKNAVAACIHHRKYIGVPCGVQWWIFRRRQIWTNFYCCFTRRNKKKYYFIYTKRKRRLENLKKNNDVFVLNSVPNTVLNFNVDLLYLLLLENILKIQYAYFKKAFPVTFDIGLHKRALFWVIRATAHICLMSTVITRTIPCTTFEALGSPNMLCWLA